MTERVWTCRRVRQGVKCGTRNYARRQKCFACGGPRPPKRQPKHRAVLATLSYEDFVALNGGEHCGICGATRKEGGRRLHRDHEHLGLGKARGLLCFRCNSRLDYGVTAEWLRAAADYLDRAECACGEINARHCPVHQETAA